MSYKEYFKELLGVETVELPSGFYSYSVSGEDMHVLAMYVAPEYRRSTGYRVLADDMADTAKKLGCSHVVSTVNVGAKYAELALRTLLKTSTIVKAESGTITLKGDVNGWKRSSIQSS